MFKGLTFNSVTNKFVVSATDKKQSEVEAKCDKVFHQFAQGSGECQCGKFQQLPTEVKK